MRALRLLSAPVLLLVMVLGMAPQPWLHACEHAAMEARHPDGPSFQDDCDLCHTGGLLATPVGHTTLAALPHCTWTHPTPAIPGTHFGYTPDACGRGPPFAV